MLTGLRAWLARRHRGLAPPPVQLLEAELAGLQPAVLGLLCHLDIPDRIASGPVAVEVLAADLDVDADRLRRVLRYAHVHGWLRLDRRGAVRPTRVTRFLERDHPGGWRAWAELAAGREIAAAVIALPEALQVAGDPFAAANGEPFFAWLTAHPQRHATFEAAMAAGARLHGLLLARALSWSASRRVCDIGGGDGTLLGVLVACHPHLRGVVLELPEVVARLPRRSQITGVAGDAFAAVPTGFDTYLLVNVLHDWDDDAAVTLLRRAAEAALATDDDRPARIVVVEGEGRARPRDDMALRSDLLMLPLTPGGRERRADELAALADRAGLRCVRTHRLGSGDLAVVLAPGPR